MLAVKPMLKAALLVGTLDISAAFIQVFIQTGQSPFQPVLAFIGRALLGRNTALPIGWVMACGLLLHYCIATTFTVLFFQTLANWSPARQRPLVTGLLYGAFIWAVMNLLVLPLSGTKPFTFQPGKNALAMGILIFCIGLPLAYMAARKKVLSIQPVLSR